jgi:hypothetical protein
MDYATAREGLLNLLRTRGRLKNGECIEAIGGDSELFDRVREDLVFNDLARNKSNAGLIYTGPDETHEPAGARGDTADLLKKPGTRDFSGREWLRRYLKDWELRDEGKVLVISGSPGSGKSAFISHWIQTEQNIVASHFCTPDVPETMSVPAFVSSVATQIAEKTGTREILCDLLPGGTYDEDSIRTIVRKISRAVRSSGNGSTPSYICIDAPEESYFSDTEFPAFLPEFIRLFPDPVRFIITCRNDARILARLKGYDHIDIDTKKRENQDDISDFLRIQLADSRVKDIPEGQKSAIVDYIAMKSEGNFLYAALMARAVLSGEIQPRYLQSRSFPAGLELFYQKEFEKMFPLPDEYAGISAVLSVVVSALTPLTLAEITSFTGEDPRKVREEIDRISSFIPEDKEGRYSCYHSLLRVWLTDAGSSHEPLPVHRFRLNRNIAEHRITDRCLKAVDGNPVGKSGYCTRYLPYHLITGERYSEYDRVMKNESFLKERAKMGYRHLLVVYSPDLKQSFISSFRADIFRMGHAAFFVPLDAAEDDTSSLLNPSRHLVDAVIFLLTKPVQGREGHRATTEMDRFAGGKTFVLPVVLEEGAIPPELTGKALDMRGILRLSRNEPRYNAKLEILDRMIKNLSADIPGAEEYMTGADEEPPGDITSQEENSQQRDIFICHKDSDFAVLTEIAKGLEKNNYTTWYYERDILPVLRHLLQTRDAIREARIFMVIISRNSIGAPQLDTEIVWAQSLGKPFVPILKDITFAEVQEQAPLWAQAIGAAVAISIPPQGVRAILPPLVQGLRGAGILPAGKKK